MNTLTPFLLTAAFVIHAVPAAGAETWSLDRAVATALDAAPAVTVERLAAESSGLDAASAHAGWYPTTTVSARANYVSRVMEIDMPLSTIRFGDYDSYDLGVRINQLLYDGGRLDALTRAAAERARAGELQAEAAALLVEYQAKTAFLGVTLADRTLDASRQSFAEARNHYAVVKARFDQGMALENDLLRADLRVAQAALDTVAFHADHAVAVSRFCTVLGIDSGGDVSVQWDGVPDGVLADHPVNGALEAIAARPEIAAFEAMSAASRFSAKSALASRRPGVGLFGAFNYGRPGLDMPANDWMHYFSAGVALTWTVWDWNAAGRSATQAELAARQAMLRREDAARTVTRQYSEAAAGLEKARDRLTLAARAADVADKTMRSVAAAAAGGTATETDYDNAHTAYTRAVIDHAAAEAMLGIAAAHMDYVLGRHYTGDTND